MRKTYRWLCLVLAAALVLASFPVMASAADLSGFQTGRVNGRTYYAKASGPKVHIYLENAAGQMVRVAVPYATGADGSRYYPLVSGGEVLFPVLANGELLSYCRYGEGGEAVPVLVAASTHVQPDLSSGFEAGEVNGRTYYAGSSGAKVKIYLENAGGQMVRVAVPYAAAQDARFYPVVCGGAVLFPQVADGALSAYVLSQGGASVPVLVPAGAAGEPAGKGVEVSEETEILPEGVVQELGAGQIRVPADALARPPQAGDILTDGYEAAYRITGVSADGSGYVCTTEEPALTDFLESVCEEGTGTVDMDQFIPEPGVVVDTENARGIQGKHSFTKKVEIEDKDRGEKMTVSVTLSEDIKKVDYKFDYNLLTGKAKDVHIILDQTAVAEVNLDASKSGKFAEQKKEFKLGSVPVAGTDKIGLVIDLWMTFSINGRVHLSAEVSGPIGLRVTNNRFENATKLILTPTAEVTATLKTGPKVSFAARIFGHDLLSAQADLGVKLDGATAIHPEVKPDGLICMDARLRLYGSISVPSGSLVGDLLSKLLGKSPTVTIWNDSSSPLKKQFHFENLKAVNACTYGSQPSAGPSAAVPSGDPQVPDADCGVLSGRVVRADNPAEGIQGARVAVSVSADDPPFLTVQTDPDGRYILRLEEGEYFLSVSAPGFAPFLCRQAVTAGQTTPVETFLIVRGLVGSSTPVGGQIVSSLSGDGIEGVQIEVREGWNFLEGNPLRTVFTDHSGNYRAELPPGNYTLFLEKNGYVSGYMNIAVTAQPDDSLGGAMTPLDSPQMPAGLLRAVLTWGAEPEDLDIHLTGPGGMHTYFGNRRCYENGVLQAALELDDISCYGPETVTLFEEQPDGVYSCYVHAFDDGSGQGSLAESGAQVTVLAGDEVVCSFFVPDDAEGNVWHVFDYNASDRTILPVNGIYTCSRPQDVGSAAMTPAA